MSLFWNMLKAGPPVGAGAGGSYDENDIYHPNISQTVINNTAFQYAECVITFHKDGTADERKIEVETRHDGASWVQESNTGWWIGAGTNPADISGDVQMRWNITGGTETGWTVGNPGTENVWQDITNGLPVIDLHLRQYGVGSKQIQATVDFRWDQEPTNVISSFTIDVTVTCNA